MYLTSGYSFVYELYVTRLNKSYPVVLGHNWLKEETPRVANPPNEDLKGYYQEKIGHQGSRKLYISFVNSIAYQQACRIPGVIALQLIPNHLKLGAQAAQINPEEPDLSNLPDKYQEFANVFDKQCLRLLPRHCPYDLSIQTKEGKTPFLGPVRGSLIGNPLSH